VGNASRTAFPLRLYRSTAGFLGVYEELRTEITEKVLPTYGLPEEVIAYTKELLDYNVPGGKLNRGLTVVHVCVPCANPCAPIRVPCQSHCAANQTPALAPAHHPALAPCPRVCVCACRLESILGDKMTGEQAHQAAVLGWCIEWLQAFFLVADDVMDGSITRRGSPCWYKLPKVGLIAINDGFLLQAHLYKFLKNHFGKHPAYVQLVELFTEVTWQTELGQLLDLTTQPADKPIDLDRFTLERYRGIVKYKTAWYSFYLPVACGLILAGLATEESLKRAEDILLLMGEYFQVQDDYLDCYADPETLGKVGTDIQDNKCSWLVVQALAKATPDQAAVLKANYGKHDAACVAAIKALYVEMGIEGVYHAYEAETVATLHRLIEEGVKGTAVPAEVYTSLLGKIYKRSK